MAVPACSRRVQWRVHTCRCGAMRSASRVSGPGPPRSGATGIPDSVTGFGVLEPSGVRISLSSRYNCQAWLSDVQTRAGTISGAMSEAAERVRRQDVYPGRMRDLRRRRGLT
jgi:hypothetical protein